LISFFCFALVNESEGFFLPFTDVQREIRREVTRKNAEFVESASV